VRLITFEKDGRPVLGVRRKDELVDLSIAAPWLPQYLVPLLAGGTAAMAQIKTAAGMAPSRAIIPPEEVTYLPPVTHPGKIICLGLNYAEHAAECRFQKPPCPILFARFASTLVGHRSPLVRPGCSAQFDYEGELVVIIGKTGRSIVRSDALSLVGGYSIFNDASVRDFQFKTPQWTMGKNFDRTGGFGPECVTADELPPGATGLRLQTRLNGAVMQEAHTSDMIFDVAEAIAFITQAMTLNPGDLVVMGTPGGIGWARDPQVFMQAGDVCEVEIEGIGTLRNPIVDQENAPPVPLQGAWR
jgi:2-keto-4-pentenoate hydratase/2-oxohepta-3-ene-1,7-dioic acid hydratase in catechol pathway